MRLIFHKIRRLGLAAGFLVLFCAGFGLSAAYAADIDESTKEVCNQVMLNIYYEILSLKDKYPELANFSEETLFENKHGLYTIVYKIDDPKIIKQARPFVFGLTVESLDEDIFHQEQGAFAFPFPLVHVKLAGYKSPYLRSTQFDIAKLAEKQGIELAMYQQKEMPLRLYMRPVKDVYKVNEPIEFEVILKNVGKTHFYVRELDERTLFFVYNGTPWGTRPKVKKPVKRDKRKKDKIPRETLKAGESISVILKGNPFSKPQEVEVLGVYKINVKGVPPAGILNITVEE